MAYQREQIHHPFSQVQCVAILPFYNQSNNPTVDAEVVAQTYDAALQAILGFEVLPVGVTDAQWLVYSQQHGEPVTGEHFQELAEQMGVEALVVGSVTDFDVYYPLRMRCPSADMQRIKVCPPNGERLSWDAQQEDDIPARIVRDKQFDLARSQLSKQIPARDAARQANRPHPRSSLARTSGHACES